MGEPEHSSPHRRNNNTKADGNLYRAAALTLHVATVAGGLGTLLGWWCDTKTVRLLLTSAYVWDTACHRVGLTILHRWTTRDVYLHHLPILVGYWSMWGAGAGPLTGMYAAAIATSSVNEGLAVVGWHPRVARMRSLVMLLWFNTMGVYSTVCLAASAARAGSLAPVARAAVWGVCLGHAVMVLHQHTSWVAGAAKRCGFGYPPSLYRLLHVVAAAVGVCQVVVSTDVVDSLR